MSRKIMKFSIPMISLLLLISCHQNNAQDNDASDKLKNTENSASTQKVQHSFGGWYCPDNLGGFPPVDIQRLDVVPVVSHRLPTREETHNGSALIYIDTIEYPAARPLEMQLPRVATAYSQHSEMDELIVVIQAVIVGSDTIVGYRYSNGGNGSARISEITFVEENALEDLGTTPYVYLTTEIEASKAKIWKAIANTDYAQALAKKYDKKEFMASEWTSKSRAHLSYDSGNQKSNGIIMTHFGNLYLQIDSDNDGSYFSEKMLVIEDEENNTAQLHIVFGPYPDDIDSQKKTWNNWLKNVKKISETE